MRAIGFGTAIALAIGAGGCAGEVENPSAEGLPARSAEGAAAPDVRVSLAGLGGAEVSGTAAFEPLEGRAAVTVSLQPLPAAGMYQGHVHEGESCEAIGRVRWSLQPVTATEETDGQSVTSLPVPMDSVRSGSKVVVFHAQGGQPVACGEIPVLPPDLPA